MMENLNDHPFFNALREQFAPNLNPEAAAPISLHREGDVAVAEPPPEHNGGLVRGAFGFLAVVGGAVAVIAYALHGGSNNQWGADSEKVRQEEEDRDYAEFAAAQ